MAFAANALSKSNGLPISAPAAPLLLLVCSPFTFLWYFHTIQGYWTGKVFLASVTSVDTHIHIHTTISTSRTAGTQWGAFRPTAVKIDITSAAHSSSRHILLCGGPRRIDALQSCRRYLSTALAADAVFNFSYNQSRTSNIWMVRRKTSVTVSPLYKIQKSSPVEMAE